jgi:hypothetical protein
MDFVSEAAAIFANPKFYYNADYGMLVCKYHGLAVVRLNVCFKDAYNLRKMKEYQPILDCYARVVLAKPHKIAVPPLYGSPFEALRKPACAFSRAECGHLSSSRKARHRQYNKELSGITQRQTTITGVR